MTNVLLLRAPSQETSDPYQECFKNLGYKPSSLPVLETVFTNLDRLKRIIVSGLEIKGFAGVIVTSARACEAWGHAVKNVVQEPLGQVADWSSVPFYVVGDATAKALADVSELYGPGPSTPRDIRGGSQTGTSERLGHFILDDLPAKEGTKLLYLTGDKNRDTLPNILADAHVILESIQVYGTKGSSTFAKDLENVVKSIPAESDRWWIIFFAPSAAEFVTPILRQSFDLPVLESPESQSITNVELAAIGPTTFTFLGDNLKLRVAVCSPEPTAEALANAIKSFEIRG